MVDLQVELLEYGARTEFFGKIAFRFRGIGEHRI